MLSDTDNDWLDYNSDIDYQADLFEFRQSVKFNKYSKIKPKHSLRPTSTKQLRSQAMLFKLTFQRDKQTSKSKGKSLSHQCSSSTRKTYECDKEFLMKRRDTQFTKRLESSKKLTTEDLTDFSYFRRHFYQINHKTIKSSLDNLTNIVIDNIRLAPVHESAQNDFTKRLNQDKTYLPELVYHGTKLRYIHSILRFGFLVPNQAHPTNRNAPMISSVNGQAFGRGIYSSRTLLISLQYTQATNTLLVCAALPSHGKKGRVHYFWRHILCLTRVSQIIPLFFVDFTYLNRSRHNYSWYYPYKHLETDKAAELRRSFFIPKKHLQKQLNLINDRVRKNEQYQIRMLDLYD